MSAVQPKPWHNHDRRRKGILTLWLLIIADSQSFAQGVTFWTSLNHKNSGNKNSYQYASRFDDTSSSSSKTGSPSFAHATKQAQECFENGQSCGVSAAPLRMLPRSRLKKRVRTVLTSAEDCCLERRPECTVASNGERSPSGSSSSYNSIPRGGHTAAMSSSPLDAVEAATAAVTPYGIPLNGWKVIFQAMLTFLNVVCWLVPLRSKKMSENKLALSLANAFSGGVFLSLAFGHLIPECLHGFHNYNEVTPFMLVLGGYLLIFFVEKVAFDTHDILHEMETSSSSGGGGKDSNGHAHNHQHNNNNNNAINNSGRSAVILLGALAVHSVLEMTALGLADTFGDSALLTLSIALHQPAESIALLVAFLKSGLPETQILRYLSIFSAMGPIGVAIGMAVNEFAAPIVDAIMLAVVAGTFVYVGATEVIPEEWEDSEHKWKKFGALMAGIVSIYVITQYTMTLESH